ncbi:AI-2E family transporter [Paracoccus pacificus]|uniref:AI-2E family transporter n=1 Tax=Paracoccus pacificus TaxID=1463598 RepID=A0ABW4R220_9RHOB
MADKTGPKFEPNVVVRPSGRTIHMFPTSGETPAKNPANWAIVGIFLIMCFGAIALAKEFLLPATLGILLFFVFVPLRRWMDRRGIPPSITAAIVTIGMVLGVFAISYTVSGPAGQLIQDAPSITRQLKEKYENFRSRFRGIEEAAAGLGTLGTGSVSVAPTVVGNLPDAAEGTGDAGGDSGVDTGGNAAADGSATTTVTTTPNQTGGTDSSTTSSVPAQGTVTTGGTAQGPDSTVTATSTVSSPGDHPAQPAATNTLKVEVTDTSSSGIAMTALSFGPAVVGQILFTLIFLFFLLASGDLLYLRIVQSFDTMAKKRAAYNALREIEESLGAYLGAITIINAALGVIIGVTMWAWGMPSPILWGIAGFLLNYVPYIGAMIGYVGSALVALVVFDDVWTAVLVGGSYLALTAIEGQFITPHFVARRLQLNTVVVFLTVALWAWLWSILGMVVAVPMLVVLRVLSEHIPALEKFGNFLAGEEPPGLEEDDDEQEEAAAKA